MYTSYILSYDINQLYLTARNEHKCAHITLHNKRGEERVIMKANGTTAATTVKPSFVSHMAESTTLSLLTSSAHEKDTWPSAHLGMAIASLWSKILGKRADAEVTVLQLISAAKCHEHIWKSMWHFVLLKGGKQTRWCSTGWQQLRPLLQLGHLTDLAGLVWVYLLCKGQSNRRIGSLAMDCGYEWIWYHFRFQKAFWKTNHWLLYIGAPKHGPK